MRTIAGYSYICKACGKRHLITNNETCKYIDKSKKIDLICPHTSFSRETYDKKSFSYYHGAFFAVCDIIIDEKCRIDCFS